MTIFDCFTYYGSDAERRLLALRLAETHEVVDRWVLVESASTFSGKPKPLHFSERHRHDPEIAPYADRITAVVAALPADAVAWSREAAQRAAITPGLYAAGVRLEDWVLISDLDEIPSADAIRRVSAAPHPGVYMFAQRMAYYFINCVADKQPWYGTRMARWRDIPNPQVVRHLGGHNVSNGGWHFSYMGGTEAIREKIEAYSHQELNTPAFTAEDHIAACLREGRDLFGREDMTFAVQPLDASYPAHIMADTRPFMDWIAPFAGMHQLEPKEAVETPIDANEAPIGENPREEVIG